MVDGPIASELELEHPMCEPSPKKDDELSPLALITSFSRGSSGEVDARASVNNFAFPFAMRDSWNSRRMSSSGGMTRCS